jgi:hypothetical protein
LITFIRVAEATEKSAAAAADNVLATRELANLERPWLMIYPNSPTNWPFNDNTRKPPSILKSDGVKPAEIHELEQRMDTLAREYGATHDPKNSGGTKGTEPPIAAA